MLFGEVGPGRYCTFFSLFSGHPIMESTDAEIKERKTSQEVKESRRFSKSNLPLEVRLCLILLATIIFFIFFISKLAAVIFILTTKTRFFLLKNTFLLFIVLSLYLHNILSFLGSMWSHMTDRTQSKQVMIWWHMRDRLRINFGSINESFREQITRFHSIFVSCCAAVIWIFTFGMSYKH